VSFTRRIIDSARSGINTVMDRIAADDTPLSHVDEAVLQYEVEQRTKARRAAPANPMDNPRARLASASSSAQDERRKLADARAARVHAVRDKRAAAERKSREEQFRRTQEKAQAGRAAHSTRPGSQRSQSNAGSRRSSAGSADGGKLAKYYKVLDLPVGAPFEDIKKSYRQLMRKYHPDRHMGNPKKQKAATELTMRVTEAYKELEDHVKKST
jgi:DnaJ-domain-containing protein 1